MTTRVAVAILEKDGKVLVGRRRKGGSFPLLWEFPGGKIRDGESPQECLARELEEELGIDATIGPFVCATNYGYDFGSVELLVFGVKLFSGFPEARVHEELRWVAAEELEEYDLPPASRPIALRLAGTYGARRDQKIP